MLADIIRHSEDKINETLDLMGLKTLKLFFANIDTKRDCKSFWWIELGQQVQEMRDMNDKTFPLDDPCS